MTNLPGLPWKEGSWDAGLSVLRPGKSWAEQDQLVHLAGASDSLKDSLGPTLRTGALSLHSALPEVPPQLRDRGQHLSRYGFALPFSFSSPSFSPGMSNASGNEPGFPPHTGKQCLGVSDAGDRGRGGRSYTLRPTLQGDSSLRFL